MSGNPDEEKEAQKALPLDLARTQITTVRTVESSKAPLVMTSQALRSVRVLAQGVSSSSNPSSVGQAIITNLMPQAVLKQDPNRAQITGIVGSSQSHSQPQVSGGLTLQRPAQITLSATPLVAQNSSGTSYHVPRGPAVVANLAAPRSNVTTVRAPLVVTAQNSQNHTFVRPPRTPSPAQGTAWLTTNSSNGSQIKGAPTVLSSPVRGATVTGKPQTTGRTQSTQAMPTIRSGTLLSNAITIGQTIHSFKPSGMQALGNTVTLGQMLPTRTQAVVYSANTAPQFPPNARITVATTAQNQIRPSQPRPMGSVVSGPRLAVPISQVQAVQNSRIMTPSQTTMASNNRMSLGPSSTQPQPVLATNTRIVTAQPASNVVGRLSVTPSTVTGAVSSTNNILTSQARISTLSTLNLQSLMAVANGGPARIQTTQGPKVITQPAQATIHLAQIPSQMKSTAPNVVTTAPRTINVPASIVTQRPNSVGPPQAISIAKVFPTGENQGTPGSANVFIHTPLQASVQRHASPSPGTSVPQQVVSSVPPTAPSYTLTNQEASGYFYDSTTTPAGAFQRAFVNQQSSAFVAQSQAQQSQISRPPVTVNSQSLHGMRFGSLMVVEQNRGQQQPNQFQPVAPQSASEHQTLMDNSQHQQQSQQLPLTQTKITSSPRPSILRKRDHEGSPLKAAKNLTPVLQNLNVQTPPHASSSPPSSPRPDSRDNGHSSGGSTTISATSSPGLAEVNDDSNPPVLMNIKEEEEEEAKPAVEMSPRKKPRKQQLTGNEIEENHDDMQFISESRVVKKENYDSDGQHSDLTPKDGAPEAPRIATLRKPATASLLNGYRQTWKATHNHYQRYSDVKPKDERRPTIIDLANQNHVLEKINGWKIHHLSTQMEDLATNSNFFKAEQEQSVYEQLTDLLKFTESEESTKQNDKEVNRVNELIKGNLQRIKIINDGMLEAKCNIMKVFDHQRHVNDILSRCVSKRNFKKREKS